jgi:hypothetical protein
VEGEGAELLTPPIDRGAEIRCYMRDGYLIEVGQSTALLHGKLAAKPRRISRLGPSGPLPQDPGSPDGDKRPHASFAACPVADSIVRCTGCIGRLMDASPGDGELRCPDPRELSLIPLPTAISVVSSGVQQQSAVALWRPDLMAGPR